MSLLDTTSQNLKQWIFGKQNERMEFIMDSYFKLSPEQRSGTLIGMGAFGVLVLFGLSIILHNIRRIKIAYKICELPTYPRTRVQFIQIIDSKIVWH